MEEELMLVSTQMEIVEQQKSAMRKSWRAGYLEAVERGHLLGFSELQLKNYLHTSMLNQEMESVRRRHLESVDRRHLAGLQHSLPSHSVAGSAAGEDRRFILKGANA